jgi:hypothetical protein
MRTHGAEGHSVGAVEAPDAPIGRADPTRRWAIGFPGGAARFPGVTRPEADRAAPALAALPADELPRALVAVELPVLMAEGAGPYLLDHDGRLTLALAAHPAIADAAVAMGEPKPGHRIGLVRSAGRGVWRWLALAEVAPADRLAALDALDGLPGEASVPDWERRWAGAAGRTAPDGGRAGWN